MTVELFAGIFLSIIFICLFEVIFTQIPYDKEFKKLKKKKDEHKSTS